MMTSVAFATELEIVDATIASYPIAIDGHELDVEHSQYPPIESKGVTYFPMTFDYLDGIGLELSFSSEEGLSIDKTIKGGPIDECFLGAENVLGISVDAVIATYPITVNGTPVINSEEEYPVLMYKNITYFPMTWRFAVEEFGWSTSWSGEEGFGIKVESIPVETVIEEQLATEEEIIEEPVVEVIEEVTSESSKDATFVIERVITSDALGLDPFHKKMMGDYTLLLDARIKIVTPENQGSTEAKAQRDRIKDLFLEVGEVYLKDSYGNRYECSVNGTASDAFGEGYLYLIMDVPYLPNGDYILLSNSDAWSVGNTFTINYW